MGIKQVLINKSNATREVELIMADGSVDSINLQPNGGRVTPPPGSKINPAKEASYRNFLVVHSVPDGNVESAE